MADYNKLKEQLSNPDNLITEIAGYDDYFHDATVQTCQPDVIIFAECEADIIAVVKFCHENNLPLVCRGAGTGLSGGCVPVPGSILLSLERMTQLKIDPVKKIAIAQPGVITKTIMDQAASHNLTYPPDPASYEESTIAGNIAENAGGLRCKRYGVTRDYVLGLRAITSTGEIIQTGYYNPHSGFNFQDLFTGSEGTLVCISEATLKLIYQKDEQLLTILAAFDYPKDAAEVVKQLNLSGIIITIMEFLDGDAAACSNSYEQTDGLDNKAGILLLEINLSDRKLVEKICRQHNCSYFNRSDDPNEADKLWKIRRNLSKAITAIAQTRISEDVAVPNSKFPLLVDFVAEMNKSSDLRINSFGHAGDGNLHVNFLGMDGSQSEYDEIEKQIQILLKKTIEMGGTLTGEHGIGLAKKKYLNLEYDQPTLNLMKSLKSIFDPAGIYNRTKIF